MFEVEYFLVMRDLDINNLRYNAKNLCTIEFLDMVRHSGFVVRKVFKIKKNTNIKTFTSSHCVFLCSLNVMAMYLIASINTPSVDYSRQH
jgi:hypothetical protein